MRGFPVGLLMFEQFEAEHATVPTGAEDSTVGIAERAQWRGAQARSESLFVSTEIPALNPVEEVLPQT